MKVKNNSAFRGGVIVRGTAAKLLKTKGFVKIASRTIRFPHLEIHCPVQDPAEQTSGDSASPVFRHNSEVEHLTLAFGYRAGDKESDNAIVQFRDENVVAGWIPSGSLGARALDLGNTR